MIGDGPLDQILEHLPSIKDQIIQGSCENFKLELSNSVGDGAWFTKSKLMRFFISALLSTHPCTKTWSSICLVMYAHVSSHNWLSQWLTRHQNQLKGCIKGETNLHDELTYFCFRKGLEKESWCNYLFLAGVCYA